MIVGKNHYVKARLGTLLQERGGGEATSLYFLL